MSTRPDLPTCEKPVLNQAMAEQIVEFLPRSRAVFCVFVMGDSPLSPVPAGVVAGSASEIAMSAALACLRNSQIETVLRKTLQILDDPIKRAALDTLESMAETHESSDGKDFSVKQSSNPE